MKKKYYLNVAMLKMFLIQNIAKPVIYIGIGKIEKKTDNSIGNIIERMEKRNSCFSVMLIKNNEVCPTYTRQDRTMLYDEFRSMNTLESCYVSTFPKDYSFKKLRYGYILGMSVPPVMTAQIATNIFEQWLNKIK